MTAHHEHDGHADVGAPLNGILVGIGGHLHGGGIDIGVKEDARSIAGCTAVAHYDEMEPMDFPSSITSCRPHDFVAAGGKYTMTARYDNSKPYAGVMGIMPATSGRGVRRRADPTLVAGERREPTRYRGP